MKGGFLPTKSLDMILWESSYVFIVKTCWIGLLSMWTIDESLVHQIFASIIKTTHNPWSFTIGFTDDYQTTITPKRIASIMNINSSSRISYIFYTLTEDERERAIVALCGFPARWNNRKNHLPLSSLLPIYHILHNIFTYNVYPRKGNRIELTSYMVNLLYHVHCTRPVCFASLIYQIIIKFHYSYS